MKNKLLIASLALLGAAGLSSCVTDETPKLEIPAEGSFTLNTPEFANQVYIFDCDDQGVSLNNIDLSWSQPQYGVACTPEYKVQLARKWEDFAKWDIAQAEADKPDADPQTKADADELPLAVFVDWTTTDAKVSVDGEKFCMAVNELYGLTLQNAKDEIHPVAIRIHSEVPNAPQSAIFTSNEVTVNVLSYVKPVPDRIYIIGACSGWNISNGEMYLEESEIGNRIYVGDYTIQAGQFMFRFYDELGNWDAFSIGSQMDDSPIDIKDADGNAISEIPEDGITLPCLQYSKAAGNPKGSWQIQNWKGGKVHFVVNLNDNTVTLTPGQSRKVYVIGQVNGWDINSDKVYLSETEDNSNIYTNDLDIKGNEFEFRFYTSLGDWENGSIGFSEPDANNAITVTTAGNEYPAVPGKGKYKDESWTTDGKCRITLDVNAKKVTFQKL